MTLLEVLIKKLPECDGWPKDAARCIYHEHKEGATFYDAEGAMVKNGVGFIDLCIPDVRRDEVTREQYEAALAASNPEWDGEGLPPVGCEFLFGTHHTKAKCIAVGRDVIFASTGNPDEKDGFYEEFVISIHHSKFRPIRSEADKKRDEAVKEMIELIDSLVGERANPVHGKKAVAEKFYESIAAGKIPHIRID